MLRVLNGLHQDDRIAAMQFADLPELLQGWTTDKRSVARSLTWKLHSGKRVRLGGAIIAAAQLFKDTPEGSRHVVLVTDGVAGRGYRLRYPAVRFDTRHDSFRRAG